MLRLRCDIVGKNIAEVTHHSLCVIIGVHAASGQRPEMLLSTLQCKNRLPATPLQSVIQTVQFVTSGGVRDPALGHLLRSGTDEA